MAYVCTLDVFAGRPNPVWTLSEHEGDQLQERLAGLRNTNVRPSATLPRLGYRGFLITQLIDGVTDTVRLHEGILDRGTLQTNLRVGDRQLEQWLLAQAPLDAPVRNHVAQALEQPVLDAAAFDSAFTDASCIPSVAADAPPYNPAIWNIPGVQPFNNCYNYANDHITNTFAQPGRATGNPISV